MTQTTARQSVQHVHKAGHVKVCVLARYSRDADLKQVVLDELFSQHCDAELDAELHETAAVCALIKHIKAVSFTRCNPSTHYRTHVCLIYTSSMR